MGLFDRLAGAPISWGVSEIPGWGRRLSPDRVLSEMASLGLAATELGPAGFLPDDPTELRAEIERFGLRLVGGFVPIVLHDPARAELARAQARATAQLLAEAGGRVFVSAAVVDEAWARRIQLDDVQWRHVIQMLGVLDEIVGEHGLIHALHPHAGSLIETADDVDRVGAQSDVRWCLDSGHLAIGGVDPLAFARDASDRVAHVHLKDVDRSLAREVASGELTLWEGVRRGLFRPLGRGELAIAEIVAALERSGYEGWYVLEQDTSITGDEPGAGSGPIDDVRESVTYLLTAVAHRVDELQVSTHEGRRAR